MTRDILVLGAGMVGVGIAWHLVDAGHNVRLVDRKAPGRETSFGNAGLIQREAVEPHPFPRDLRTLWRVLPNQGIDIRYRSGAMVSQASALAQYWYYSGAREFARIAPQYASLIEHCTNEHGRLIEAAGANDLIRTDGWLQLFRTEQAFESECRKAESFGSRFGVTHAQLDDSALKRMEPGVCAELAGAIHWTNAWSVVDPGALIDVYANDFCRRGGVIETVEATGIGAIRGGWKIETNDGAFHADTVVLATGPWSSEWLAQLNMPLPLFLMRGYHMHYAYPDDAPLNHGVMDFENGYLLTPKRAGLRLTTGAELNTLGAPPRYGQLDAAETAARGLFPLGERNQQTPWMGARPCLPDMKPVIGPAPGHRNLWCAFGHGHQGFTLGPATGRLIREMVDGKTPYIDPEPFRADRFSHY